MKTLILATALVTFSVLPGLAQTVTPTTPTTTASSDEIEYPAPLLNANKAVVRRYYDEMVNGGDWSAASEVIAEDLKQNSVGVPQGRAGVQRELQAFQQALTGFNIQIDEMVAEGDLVVVRATVSGTHSGELFGVPATGNEITFKSMDFFRVTDGLLAEHWDVTDRLALLQQIGVQDVPPAP